MFVNWRDWAVVVAAVVALATALSTHYFIRMQALVRQPGHVFAALAILCLTAGLAGLCAYIVVRLADVLAGRSLLAILKGEEPLSTRWLYLAVLGLVLGAGIGVFTHLALFLLARLVTA